jgi:hypothetical protein
MNALPKQSKFQAYSARKKVAGLREVRMWALDTRSPKLHAEAARQVALLSQLLVPFQRMLDRISPARRSRIDRAIGHLAVGDLNRLIEGLAILLA